MIPTLIISIGKIAAARGVPNTAEKAALIPLMTRSFRSPSSNLKSRPIVFPILPPIWRAAPSRPAEPPNKWVIIVAAKISGAIYAGTSWFFPCTAVIMMFVPLSCLTPQRWYKNTITTPPIGRKSNKNGYWPRSVVTFFKQKEKALLNAPTATPVNTAIKSHNAQVFKL